MIDDPIFSNAELFAYHKATGCPVMMAKTELLAMETEQRSRIFKAALLQAGQWGGLHDPIEDDSEMGELIRAAAKQAQLVAGPVTGRGHCHRIWQEQERILAAQGIKWFSPVLMNPFTVFD